MPSEPGLLLHEVEDENNISSHMYICVCADLYSEISRSLAMRSELGSHLHEGGDENKLSSRI